MSKRGTRVAGKGLLCGAVSAISALTLVMALNVTALAAADKGKGWELSDNGVLMITGETGEKSNTVDEAPWLEKHAEDIKKVEISGVTTLKGELFKDCVNLEEVVFEKDEKQKGITSIAGNTFAGCTSLKKVEIPKSIGVMRKDIFGYSANEDLKTSSSDISNVSGPFTGSGIEEVTFDMGTEYIADFVCANCENLKTVVIPEGVKQIGGYAFDECPNLTKIEFPSTLEKLSVKAFRNDTGLKEVTIPKNVVSVAGNTEPFTGCKNIETVTFEDGLTAIPDQIFKGCEGITTINWPKDVAEIGKEAFCNAVKYTVDKLPETVTTVKADAFERCQDTKFTVPKNMTVFTSPFDNLTEISFEEGTTKIPDSCCENVSSLTKVNFPEGLIEVGEYAFHVTSLKEIILPETVTTVGKFAFAVNKAENLEKLYVPESLKNIGASAFAEMAVNPTHYKDVIVTGTSKSKAKYIVDEFKYGKYKYTYKEIVVPTKGNTYTVGNVKYKMTNAALDGKGTVAVAGFSKKTLKSVTIPKTVKIADATFKVTAINANAFKSMSKITKITIKSTTITKVQKKAFKGLSTKAKIKVPKAKLSKYKSLFKKAGLSKKIKVSK